MVNLTNVYWFVKGIGLVKMHWKGGSIQQQYALGDTAANEQFSVPGLAEEYLVFVCVLSAQDSAECMGLTGISYTDLTVPPEAELEIPGFVFPEDIIKDDQVTPEVSIDSQEQFERPADDYELSEDQPEIDDDDRSALFAYAEAVADVGDKISGAGEAFGEAAIAYRNREITLDEFRDKFSSFKSKASGLIREIDGLSPPPAAEAIHRKLTGGLAKCDDAIDLMDGWFDTQDGGTKEATALLVAGCMKQVDEAASELEALVNQH
jgi:hypothetical protein